MSAASKACQQLCQQLVKQVLTGDKLETAINIGYLVKHVSSYVSS